MFLGRFGRWGIILDGLLQDDRFDAPRDAMDHATVLAEDRSLEELEPGVRIPDAVAFFGLDMPFTESDLKDRYRKMAAAAHPDRGGSHEAMKAVNRSFEEARKCL